MARLSHVDERGRARMVAIGEKPVTERLAIATGRVRMRPETLRLITTRQLPKGDVFAVARVAAIMAAKRTPDLIPLCHPLPLSSVTIEFQPDHESGVVAIEASVRVAARTGVEMEALTAVSVAALTIYDMCKSAEKDITILDICLQKKTGGKSGTYRRAVPR